MNSFFQLTLSLFAVLLMLSACDSKKAPPPAPDTAKIQQQTEVLNKLMGRKEQPPVDPPQDSSHVRPEIREIVDRILAKNAEVQSYTCVQEGHEVSVDAKGERFEFRHHEERLFKQPHKLRVTLTAVVNPIKRHEGQIHDEILDGKSRWTVQWPCPPCLQTELDEAPNMGDEEKEELRREHEVPYITRTDIAQLKEAGLWEKNWGQWESTLQPFQFCDLATLRLESEDAEYWTFTAQPVPSIAHHLAALTVKISKSDHVKREVRAKLADTDGENIQQIRELVLNPELADELFTYTPPEGAAIHDGR